MKPFFSSTGQVRIEALGGMRFEGGKLAATRYRMKVTEGDIARFHRRRGVHTHIFEMAPAPRD